MSFRSQIREIAVLSFAAALAGCGAQERGSVTESALKSARPAPAVHAASRARLAFSSLNEFFGLPPEIIRSTRTFGDFTSDPRCFYDADLGRFFLTLLQADIDPGSGDFTGRTSVLIAVSRTSDPT